MTKEEIYEMAIDFINKSQPTGNPDIAAYWFQHGASKANEKNAARIAELEDLLCLAKTHLKSVLSATKTGRIIPVEFLEKEIAKFEKHTEQ